MHKSTIILILSCISVAAMMLSPFVLSLSMFALVFVAFFKIEAGNLLKVGIDEQAINRIKLLFHHPAIAIIPLSFIIVLLSFWQTEDWMYWWNRLKIKLPFLVLPIIFIALPKFQHHQIKSLFYFLLLLLTACNCFILGYYLNDYEQVIELMKKGQPMWTPRNHIRYSLLLAWGVVGGIYLIKHQFYWKYPWEKVLIISLTLFAFLFVHFLSVKSGILILYAGLLAWVLHYIFVEQKYLLGLGLFFLLSAVPYGAYLFFPTLQSKIAYTIYDLKMYAKGEGGLYSDAGRIASLKTGVAIGRKAPVFGVGAGNLRREVHDYFDKKYPDYVEKFMPQNQFLFLWAGTGIWGLILFCLAFAFPLFYRSAFRQELFWVFYIMQFITIMIEHSYENAVGIAQYLFFLLIFLHSKEFFIDEVEAI